MTTPTLSPTTTTVELTAVEIIEEAITNHLNLRTLPPSPQLTLPLCNATAGVIVRRVWCFVQV